MKILAKSQKDLLKQLVLKFHQPRHQQLQRNPTPKRKQRKNLLTSSLKKCSMVNGETEMKEKED